MKVPIFEHNVVQPFKIFGLKGSFWNVHLDTLLYTWLAMALLAVVVMIGRSYLRHGENTWTVALESLISFFKDLCIESFGHFKNNYFVFITSLFLFTLSCNLVGVLPFSEESTKDLNTTLAIALVSFVYIQRETIKKEGFKAYVKEYFQPIFLLFPINLIEKLAKIISMSFRLFGNILGGSIIMYLLVQALARYQKVFMVLSLSILIGYWLIGLSRNQNKWRFLRNIFFVGWMLLYCLAGIKMFFGVFEGAIQAFVVAMLTTTYLSVVMAHDASPQDPSTCLTNDEKEKLS